MSFDHRMATGSEHEVWVRGVLQSRGWQVEPFGQGQLTETMRSHLRSYRTDSGDETPMRWMPDLIAALRTPDGRTHIRLIDAKAGDGCHKYGNHDVEMSALHAAVTWSDMFRISVWFVFIDFSCIDAETLAGMPTVKSSEKGVNVKWPGSWHGTGSGTPFWLFRAETARPLDREFPSVMRDY